MYIENDVYCTKKHTFWRPSIKQTWQTLNTLSTNEFLNFSLAWITGEMWILQQLVKICSIFFFTKLIQSSNPHSRSLSRWPLKVSHPVSTPINHIISLSTSPDHPTQSLSCLKLPPPPVSVFSYVLCQGSVSVQVATYQDNKWSLSVTCHLRPETKMSTHNPTVMLMKGEERRRIEEVRRGGGSEG